MAITTGTAILLSAGIGAANSVIQGRQAQAQGEFSAQVREQQAQREAEVSRENERDFLKQSSADLAQIRAAQGASGVRLDTGSPVVANRDFLSEVELQAERIRRGGEIRSTRLRQQATLDRFAGNNANRAGLSRAGASLLTGIGNARQFG